MDNNNNDVISLFIIQKDLDEYVSPNIVEVMRSKETWDSLKMTYGGKGSNNNQHQAKF